MHAPRFSSAVRSVALAFVVALAALAAPPRALAAPKGDQATVDKVTNLNKKALDAYAHEDYDTARALLKEALELCANAGLDQHPITARTHIHFGAVAIVGFKQREVGIKQFRKALEIQPDIKLTKVLVTPELQDAFEEAVLAGNGQGGGDQAGGGPAGGPEGGEEGGQRQRANQQAEDNGEGGESTPPPRRAKAPPRKKRGGDDDDDKDKDKDDEAKKGPFFLSFGVGTGAGLAKGNGTLDPGNHVVTSPGFATTQGPQFGLEVGYFAMPELLVSAALRFQYLFGLTGEPVTMGCGSDNFCSPSSTALAFFAKATYLFGTEGTRFALGGQIGGGYIRHAVPFDSPAVCKNSPSDPMLMGCVDTLNGGPFLIGPTFGLFFDLGSSIDLIIAANTALGLPNFTFNIDAQINLALRL
jgi:hypothetical protein